MPIHETLNLHSYSSSAGFCGYFSYKGKNPALGATEANAAISSFIESNDNGNNILFTSLQTATTDTELKKIYNYTENQISLYLKPAIDCTPALLIRHDGVPGDLTVVPLCEDNQSELFGVCYAIMAIGGIHGHLFIYIAKKRLFLYLHDDTGFGVIAEDSSGHPAALAFLEGIDTELFDVFPRLADD